MPWSANSELPPAVRDNLPEEAQSIWRKVANNAISQYGDEGKAFATAWSALRRSGWDKDKNGKWHRVDKEQPTSSGVHVNTPMGDANAEQHVKPQEHMHINKIDSNGESKHYVFEIAKAIPEKRLAFGWVLISRDAQGREVFDLQNDGIDPDELEDLAYRYVRFYRDSGELHITKGAAVVVESVVTTMEKQEIWGIPRFIMPIGWWCGFYVKDDDVWEKVKNGTYKAFSIEGSALRKEVI